MKEVLNSSIVLFVILVLVPSVRAASPPSLDASGYEIPLGELNKVKKDRPVKKERREHKKKGVGAAVQSPPVESGRPSLTEKTGRSVSNKPEMPRASIGPATIHHDPYSYVVTGKRTTIQAVISSTDSLQSVYCRFRSTESGTNALVPMVQVPGTHFTYAATLPGLAATSRTLRYSVITVDSTGNESRSQEFAIAAKSSAVLPGWQQDISSEKIKIRLENKETPFEGFSDPGIGE